MRYRSAAFALKSAHALASPGSTHFPARGVDADALLSPAAVLYLLRFAGDIITAEQTLVTGVVPPVRVVATVVLVAFVEIVRIDVVRPTLPTFAVVIGLGAKRWRRMCCRTGRDSPWQVYCALKLERRDVQG